MTDVHHWDRILWPEAWAHLHRMVNVGPIPRKGGGLALAALLKDGLAELVEDDMIAAAPHARDALEHFRVGADGRVTLNSTFQPSALAVDNIR